MLLLSSKRFFPSLILLSIIWIVFANYMDHQNLPSLTPEVSNEIGGVPDFNSHETSRHKKQAFLDFLFPIIVDENLFLMRIRTQLEEFKEKQKLQSLNESELEWLNQLKMDYLIETDDIESTIDALLRKVDIIPPSLVLAQAALESGWGSSRIAQESNNLFGHRCFEEGCGAMPIQRGQGNTHESAKFDSINESIRSYLKNLNSFHRYKEFRTLRSQTELNQGGKGVLKLLPGLMPYSELGELYLRKVAKMIKQNKLHRYDALFYEQINKK